MSNPFNILTEEVFVQKMSEKTALLRKIATKIKEGGIGGGGTVDENFSLTSTNAIQNKAILAELVKIAVDSENAIKKIVTWKDLITTVSFNANSTVNIVNENSDIAIATYNNGEISITGGNTSGETIIIVTCEGNDTIQSRTKILYVHNIDTTVLSVLNNNSPSTIQSVAKSGQAPNLWSIGDKIGIALNGTVCSLSLNDTYYAFIIGFNHNSDREGTNTIDFQFGKTSSGTNIAFCDSSYGSGTSGNYFTMNISGTNIGGWGSSRMRTTVLPSFKAIMPSEWQNVISARTMYTDNTGGSQNNSSSMTTTSDDIWLLSEYEVFGSRSYANSAESTYQKQYAYYANGNSKIFYKHSDTSTAVYWWLRSPSASSSSSFCRVAADGSANGGNANSSLGLAPGFRIS